MGKWSPVERFTNVCIRKSKTKYSPKKNLGNSLEQNFPCALNVVSNKQATFPNRIGGFVVGETPHNSLFSIHACTRAANLVLHATNWLKNGLRDDIPIALRSLHARQHTIT